jgi:hypothetical protein
MLYLKVLETSYWQQKPVYVALFYKKLDNGETKPCLLAKYLRRTSSVAYTKKKRLSQKIHPSLSWYLSRKVSLNSLPSWTVYLLTWDNDLECKYLFCISSFHTPCSFNILKSHLINKYLFLISKSLVHLSYGHHLAKKNLDWKKFIFFIPPWVFQIKKTWTLEDSLKIH